MSKNARDVLQLKSGGYKWWNKPLVRFRGRLVPAELAVLSIELRPGEKGAWLNSRGTDSGVVGLICSGEYVTRRMPLPAFVSALLERVHSQANVKRGCPDLVIWNPKTERIRLVEVKCPQWDRPSQEQKQFIRAAESLGISAKIIEWEFQGRAD